MQSSNIPSKIPLPFAYSASGSYINTIPTASQIGIVNGKASLTDGFPPLTFSPISAGGVWNSCLLEENPHQLGNQGKEYVHTIFLFLIDQLLSFRLILLKLFC